MPLPWGGVSRQNSGQQVLVLGFCRNKAAGAAAGSCEHRNSQPQNQGHPRRRLLRREICFLLTPAFLHLGKLWSNWILTWAGARGIWHSSWQKGVHLGGVFPMQLPQWLGIDPELRGVWSLTPCAFALQFLQRQADQLLAQRLCRACLCQWRNQVRASVALLAFWQDFSFEPSQPHI